MFSKLWFINIALALGVIFFSVKTYDVWSKKERQYPETVSFTRQSASQERQFAMRNLPPESTYRAIADKNLFSEDRAEYLPPTPDPELDLGLENEAEIKPFEGFGKSVNLYGVFIWDDVRRALITNPNAQRGEPKDIWVEKGDVLLEVRRHNKIATLKVDDILGDRILVRDESDKYEILLYDKDKPRQRETIQTDQSPEVISSNETPRASAQPRRNPPQRRNQVSENGNIEPPNQTTQTEPEYEIINTPFGEIKRRIN